MKVHLQVIAQCNLILSYLILSYLILSYLIPFYSTSFHHITSHHTIPQYIESHHTSFYPQLLFLFLLLLLLYSSSFILLSDPFLCFVPLSITHSPHWPFPTLSSSFYFSFLCTIDGWPSSHKRYPHLAYTLSPSPPVFVYCATFQELSSPFALHGLVGFCQVLHQIISNHIKLPAIASNYNTFGSANKSDVIQISLVPHYFLFIMQ